MTHHLQGSSLRQCAWKLSQWLGFVTVLVSLSLLWIVAIPLLMGSLFELAVLVHLRVEVHQSHIMPLHQDWAVGLLLLKLWVRFVVMGGRSAWCREWRRRFEQVIVLSSCY